MSSFAGAASGMIAYVFDGVFRRTWFEAGVFLWFPVLGFIVGFAMSFVVGLSILPVSNEPNQSSEPTRGTGP